MKNIAKITLLAAACFIVNTALAQDKVKTTGEKTAVSPRPVKPVTLKAFPVKSGTPAIQKVERAPARDVTKQPSSTQKTAINEEGLTHDDKTKTKKRACKRGGKARGACKPGCTKNCCASHKKTTKEINK